MFLISLLSFFILVDASLTNMLHTITLETHASTPSTKETDKKVEFTASITSDTMKILVVNEHCNLIKQFSLSHNFSFDCRHKYLPIDFLLKHHTGEEKVLTGYMHSNINELFPKQEISDVCVKIRR